MPYMVCFIFICFFKIKILLNLIYLDSHTVIFLSNTCNVHYSTICDILITSRKEVILHDIFRKTI
jgi:hypothetical protein